MVAYLVSGPSRDPERTVYLHIGMPAVSSRLLVVSMLNYCLTPTQHNYRSHRQTSRPKMPLEPTIKQKIATGTNQARVLTNLVCLHVKALNFISAVDLCLVMEKTMLYRKKLKQNC
jgi:hypothetical protein